MKPSGIDWLKVVRLHKQIVATAQQDAYELAVPERGDRWTSLDRFEPAEMSGPWAVSVQAIRTPAFLEAVISERGSQCCLAGPGFLRFKKDGPGSDLRKSWSPLLCREVKLDQEGEVVRITPSSSHWYLSPLVLDRLSKKEVALEIPESELVTQILQAVSAGNGPMSERCRTALFQRVPELTEDFSKEWRGSSAQQPSPWFLFQIPQKVSGYDQNLMRDYDALESALETNPIELGGLALLDRLSVVPPVPKEPPIPVVPLNAEQDEAVRRIVGTQPVTVVSGPPGCGKSQVVTSAIMNCWSEGKSVLFASTNNRAVDVVRERMERFENQYPVAIRAGRKDKNDIDQRLGDIDNLGAQARQSEEAGPAADARIAKEELVSKRKVLADKLASEKPQRIDELIRTAAQAYSDHLARLQSFEENLATQHRDLQSAYGSKIDSETAAAAATATRTWLVALQSDQARSVQAAQQRDMLERERLVLVSKLKSALSDIGVFWEPESPRPLWSHRADLEHNLNRWRASFLSATACDLRQLWQPIQWERGFDRWADVESAKSAAKEASEIRERIRAWKTQAAAEIKNVETKRLAAQAARQTALAGGVPEQVSKHLEVLMRWKSAWLNRKAAKRSFGDFFGLGREAQAKQAFKEAETKLFGILPTNYRGQIESVIDLAIDWAASAADVAQIEQAVSQKEAELHALTVGVLDQPVGDIPTTSTAWRTLELKLQKFAEIASRAAAAIDQRGRQREQIERIRLLIVELQTISAESPVLQAWCRGSGREHWDLVSQLPTGGEPEGLQQIRARVLAGLSTEMVAAVDDISTQFDKLGQVQSAIRSCESEDVHLARWWSSKPRGGIPTDAPSRQVWPTKIWSDALEARVGAVERSAARIMELNQVDRPKIQALGVESLNWARRCLLDAAAELLPEDGEQVVRLVEAQSDGASSLDFAEIRGHFHSLEPDVIKAEIAAIDRQLEAGSFLEGQQRWWERLAADDDAYEAVGKLRQRLRRTYQRLDASDAPTFERALRLVPVWISTAQASQAIPVAPGLFDLVIIDEASQCTLTNILPLLFRAKRIAIIGDPHQLPAITSISQMQEQTIATKLDAMDLLDCWGHCEGKTANDMYAVATRALPRRKADVIYLREHFRSHPQIIGFANHFIYSDGLRLKRQSRDVTISGIQPGVHGVSVQGKAERQAGSWVNPVEAEAVIELIQDLRSQGVGGSVGVVTPFRAQKDLLAHRLLGLTADGEGILVDTANGFQGDERDVIIFSPAIGAGMPASTVRWAEQPPNLVNVALTRARDALYVVSDFDFCSKQSGIFRSLADYVRRIDRLRKSSIAELELYSWMVLEGWQPEAQARVSDHKVDFLLAAPSGRRIAIEIDGKQFHASATQRDRAIDAALEGAGLTVLRVSGKEALDTPQSVIEKIRRIMAS